MGTLILILLLGVAQAVNLNGAPADLLSSATKNAGPIVNTQQGTLGVPMQIVLLMTGLTLLPVLLMSVTPFLRITLVLHFLRQAIGTQSTPSNPVLIGLALFLTLMIMQPTLQKSYEEGWVPYEKQTLSSDAAWKKGTEPIRAFLVKYVREKDVQMLLDVSHTPAPANASALEFRILMPAYVLSELKTGFQIGAMLFLPFLIIDLLVASVTLSVGIVQLPPAMVSSPFKILLFVLVDGWNLVAGSLVRSFY
ncbi:MAG: flagellar type III secretion system pore protein FliP [Bryobacterales bacterium]|nr:flagellar type III secretion system pore protein FliP [Bryobacterales bacterium]